MEPRSFNVDLESCTSYHLSGNGSYLTNTTNRDLLSLPVEIWLEETKAEQIRRNVNQCLMFRNGYHKALLTGLKPFGEPRWYKGNFLRYVAGKPSKIQLVIFIAQDKLTIEIYRPLVRAKKKSGKEKSLPDVFKSSQMKSHLDTQQR
jgi:hypothetical protein